MFSFKNLLMDGALIEKSLLHSFLTCGVDREIYRWWFVEKDVDWKIDEFVARMKLD